MKWKIILLFGCYWLFCGCDDNGTVYREGYQNALQNMQQQSILQMKAIQQAVAPRLFWGALGCIAIIGIVPMLLSPLLHFLRKEFRLSLQTIGTGMKILYWLIAISFSWWGITHCPWEWLPAIGLLLLATGYQVYNNAIPALTCNDLSTLKLALTKIKTFVFFCLVILLLNELLQPDSIVHLAV